MQLFFRHNPDANMFDKISPKLYNTIMKTFIIENSYPIEFRSSDSEKLGLCLQNRRSVVLVGMKRVGISNFLRFFLNHKDIKKKYIGDETHIFIPVDLNNLVEREIFPFWILTFKRIADFVEENVSNPEVKKKISQLFLDSIQTQDLFLTIDGVRKSLIYLCEAGFNPTIFFIRFDRMIDVATQSFFANFQGLIDATQNKLSFVFTSVRPLDAHSSSVFTKHALTVFADTLYVKPAVASDIKIIFEKTIEQYPLKGSMDLEPELLRLVDGYNQYLHYALIALHEEKEIVKKESLFDFLFQDERIALQSEELWESLSEEERQVLKDITRGTKQKEPLKGAYLFKTGLVTPDTTIFSPLFERFLHEKTHSNKKEGQILELSKKEHLLLTFLKQNMNDVCEREKIIECVWPEAETLGVSDWAIDRLVARLRNKLKSQNAKEEIVTVKTRGYKLVDSQ
ncbi:MAG: helix-turn-helix domain-containing protein [Candidatus Levybacteria bacterium]|nr:helix-turn-helix domain-containing protein [Candidatus Levybacteria bacterium]